MVPDPAQPSQVSEAESQRLLVAEDVQQAISPASSPRRTSLIGALLVATLAAVALCVALTRSPGRDVMRPAASTGLYSEKAKRKGSFLVIGDWGWDSKVHGPNIRENRCQRLIAEKMLEKFRELGDVKFIINVGDSFYPHGVRGKDDPQWDSKWRKIYHEELRSVPWYTVYGNHDLIGDPCACASNSSAECALVNPNITDLDYFYMPDVNWNKEHPELDLEVVAMDTNEYEWSWNHHAPQNKQCPLDCAWTKCQEKCEWNMKYRARDALRLLKDRYEKSPHKNLVVFSHYPTDYFWNHARYPLLQVLRDNSKHKVEYFAGHRHSTDRFSTIPTHPNNNWLVGGGGGWSCDSPHQGIVVGLIDENSDLKTYPVYVPHWHCCDKPGPPTPPGPPGWKPPTCKLSPWVKLKD
eukprot:TRINITY_DN29137_c0_g1_i1.p1 TRINITY_DN29137_c0_g1~~TRINITY_DN29137_c0_g1_i1.p1  ORF type:complete len:409 (+),score=60.29 TRINITY_DN29137_c0_g1_i1:31-1257(+)